MEEKYCSHSATALIVLTIKNQELIIVWDVVAVEQASQMVVKAMAVAVPVVATV